MVNDTSLRTFLVSYRIVVDGEKVGGVVIKVSGENGDLELLFVSPSVHSKGIGYAAWCEVERLHPEIKVWETVTPYFEQRNIHFYVNRCGFHIVEFFNKYHPDPNDPEMRTEELDEQFPSGMFRFEKIYKYKKYANPKCNASSAMCSVNTWCWVLSVIFIDFHLRRLTLA